MGPYLPSPSGAGSTHPSQSEISVVGVYTTCGEVWNQGTTVFVPGVLGLQIRCVYGIFLIRRWDLILSPGGADSTNLSQSAISRWGWGFHTVRGGVDPGDNQVSQQYLGGVEASKDS